MSPPHDAVVIVVCKAPERGRVKTRLAKDIGEERAYHVYSILMATLFANLSAGAGYDVCACVDGDIALVQAGTVDPIKQYGASLGERIINAIKDCSSYPVQIVIGSDTPNITVQIVQQAVTSLDAADVVIGPAHDGGYYLIGMKQLHEGLFEGISWSTEHVLEQTLERATSAGLSVVQLPALRDIDTVDDLTAVMPELLSQ
jgi:rSAM/selenodomain-associated transferase 1